MVGKKTKNSNMMALLLIPVAVAINVVGAQITNITKLPVYIDIIGTILAACIAGPMVGITTAALSTLVNAVFRPQALPFIVTGVAIAFLVAMLSKAGMFRSVWKTAISGILINLVSVLISTPIQIFVFGGFTGSGTSIVSAGLVATGRSLLSSLLSVGIVFGMVDKISSSLIAYCIIRNMSERFLSKFSYGYIYLKNKEKN